MLGANGGADPKVTPERRWDMALPFAGAQRDYVAKVAQALQAQRVRCFYDADEQIELSPGRLRPPASASVRRSRRSASGRSGTSY